MRCFGAALLLCGLLFAQAQAPDRNPLAPETLLLARIKQKMAENLSGLPNYTCTELIERSRRDKPTKRYRLIDTVRLEVALVSGKELFAWPGERNFQDRELGDMVTGGAIGNGNFALHAKAIFEGNTARFTYLGEQKLDGRNAVRYDYDVPQFRSALNLRVGSERGIAGYHGSFWVDADTLDLRRLEVRTTDIPPNLPLESSSDIMEYDRVMIGEHDFLLPKSSELVLVDVHGNESRNRVQLSNCRQYSGESTLVFDDAPSTPAAAAVAVEEFEVPPGLELDIVIEKAPFVEQAAIGDRISGTVGHDVKAHKEVIIPKRAKVSGRISLLERDPGTGSLLVALELSEVEFPGRRGRVTAHLLEADTFAVLDNWRLLSPGASPAVRARMKVPRNIRNVFTIPANAVPRARQAVRTLWRTEAVPKETP